MKNLWKTLALIAGIGFSVNLSAQPFDSACEVYYWELHRDSSDLTIEQFQAAGCSHNSTKLIREAEEYKEALQARRSQIEQQVEERVAVAQGERAGKVVRRFELDDLASATVNPMSLPIVAESTKFEDGKASVYTTNEDYVCKQLGYTKALRATYSRMFDDGVLKDRQEGPQRIMEFRKRSLWKGGGYETVIHDVANHNQRSYGIAFKYFRTLDCEKTRQVGEPEQDFEIDIEQIRLAVEDDVEPPRLDDEVARILSLNRGASQAIENEVGEQDIEPREQGDEERFEPTKWQDNPFVYESTER